MGQLPFVYVLSVRGIGLPLAEVLSEVARPRVSSGRWRDIAGPLVGQPAGESEVVGIVMDNILVEKSSLGWISIKEQGPDPDGLEDNVIFIRTKQEFRRVMTRLMKIGMELGWGPPSRTKRG